MQASGTSSFAVELRRWLASPAARGPLLALVYLLLALHGLGDAPIVGDDEAREVGIVQDVVRGHVLWPRFNDDTLPDKPTGYHWLAAIPTALAGFSETAVRLPSALCGAALVWWTVAFGTRLVGPASGTVAGVLLATMVALFTRVRVARPDVLLTLCLALALGAVWGWWRDGDRRQGTWALVWAGAATLAKGPVGPVIFAIAVGGFLLWQRALPRLRRLPTLAGVLGFAVLGLGWYALALLGWGDLFVQEHLVGRYVRNLAGGLPEGGDYSTNPIWYHLSFYVVHLPMVVMPWTPFLAVALWRLWRRDGFRDPRARFLVCWALAPAIAFTPAEWKLRYYLLPALPALALLMAPTVEALLTAPRGALRPSRASLIAAGVTAVLLATGTFVALARPDWLARSDRLTVEAFVGAHGGAGAAAAVLGLTVGVVSGAIAYRAWSVIATGVAVVATGWLLVAVPRMEADNATRASFKPFAQEAAARFRDAPLVFYGKVVRQIVVYAERPIPALARDPGKITPGMGVIAFEPAQRALSEARLVGPVLAAGAGRLGNVSHGTLTLSEGRVPPAEPILPPPPEPAADRPPSEPRSLTGP
ncbi:MAG: glycosyltransferase family 39 protein [bacterium]|nr:glycosyltransferase family 39 protein [bacterium]